MQKGHLRLVLIYQFRRMTLLKPDIHDHNNPTLPFIDHKSARGGYYTVNALAERSTIPIAKRGNMLVNVVDTGLFRYLKENDFTNVEWVKNENWENIKNVKYIPVTASRDLNNSDSGKCLIIENSSISLNIVAGLDVDFNCTIKATTGNDGTITKAASIITQAPNGLLIAENKMISIGRLKYDAIDKYIITP